MSFFDENLSVDVKKKIVLSIFKDEDSDKLKCKKFEIKLNEIERFSDIDVDHFINAPSFEF